MLPTIIPIIAIVSAVAIWVISTQRKLTDLNENINNTMSQIGVELTLRFDALMELLVLTKEYAKHEREALIETIKSRRSAITAKSTTDDVLSQEVLISDALGRISAVAEQYPELEASHDNIKLMEMIQNLENMMIINRLIYNDSVDRLNRAIRLFPVCMIAGVLGFKRRKYLYIHYFTGEKIYGFRTQLEQADSTLRVMEEGNL